MINNTCVVNEHGKRVPVKLTVKSFDEQYMESRSGNASDFLLDTPVVTKSVFNELKTVTNRIDEALNTLITMIDTGDDVYAPDVLLDALKRQVKRIKEQESIC